MDIKTLKVKENDILILVVPIDKEENLIYDMDSVSSIIKQFNNNEVGISIAALPENFSLIHLEVDKSGELV